MKVLMKKNNLLRLFAAAALVIGTAASVNAQPITWDLENVAFNDGTFATGSFVYDPDLNTYGQYSISVKQGTLSAYTYNNQDSLNFDLPSPYGFLIGNNDRYITMKFSDALSDAGGSIALEVGSLLQNYECDDCSVERRIIGGSVTAEPVSAVPEPGSVALLGVGMLGLGALRRKKSISSRLP